MESFTDAELTAFTTLFNPSKASDLVAFGLSKDIAECVMKMITEFKGMFKYKPLNAGQLIKDGVLEMKKNVKITSAIETKKSVK